MSLVFFALNAIECLFCLKEFFLYSELSSTCAQITLKVVGIISKLKDKEDTAEICAELEQVLENIKSSELYTPIELQGSSRESFIGGGIA